MRVDLTGGTYAWPSIPCKIVNERSENSPGRMPKAKEGKKGGDRAIRKNTFVPVEKEGVRSTILTDIKESGKRQGELCVQKTRAFSRAKECKRADT